MSGEEDQGSTIQTAGEVLTANVLSSEYSCKLGNNVTCILILLALSYPSIWNRLSFLSIDDSIILAIRLNPSI
jgi:hypothetical protein